MQVRFIVIDDAPFIRELLKNIVTARGATFVGEAGDGVEGLELAERSLPDLVFLDIVMPHQNGFETAKKLKEKIPDVKIIGCSTMDGSDILEKAQACGIDAYVGKPFTKQQIFFEIENLFPRLSEAVNE